MSSPPESKDEVQPLRRSTRKSVAAKIEETVVTPRKRKSTATPLKNVPEKTEVVGTPRRTRAAATPRKSLVENVSTPKKNASNAHTEETPKKKLRSSPNNSNDVDKSPISKRTPRKSRAKEDLKKTDDQEVVEETSKVADEELNTNRRGRRKSVATNPGRKKNEKSVETTIEENIEENGIAHLTEESKNEKQDIERDLPNSFNLKKKTRKSVHFKSDIDEHHIESDDSPPSNSDQIAINEIHQPTVEERTCKSSLALAPKAIIPSLKQEMREANPAESILENTVSMPNTLAESVCIADVPERTDNYSAMESQLDKALLSPKNFLNSDEEESDSATSSNKSAITNELDHIKNKCIENISRTEDEINFKSPRRKLSYENKTLVDNEVNKISEQKVLNTIECSSDLNSASPVKSEILLSPQMENGKSEIINQNVLLPEITLNSTKYENNLPTKNVAGNSSPTKANEVQVGNESYESRKEITVTSNSDDDINADERMIMNNGEEKVCGNSDVTINSTNTLMKDSQKAESISNRMAADLQKSSSSNVTEQENLVNLSASSDSSNSEHETINIEAKAEVVTITQNCESNTKTGNDTEITVSDVGLCESDFDKNEKEQKSIEQISHSSPKMNSSSNISFKNEVKETECKNIPDDKNEDDIQKSFTAANVEIASPSNIDSFEENIKNEESITSDLNKTSAENAFLQSGCEDINKIMDESAKKASNLSEVKATEEECQEEMEGKSDCTREETPTKSGETNTDIKAEEEEGVKCIDQLDSSILVKEDHKEGCLVATVIEQSHSNNSEPSSAESHSKSIFDEDENKENDIICQNQSNVSLKVSYFEKLEQSFDKDRTSLKKKDKGDKTNNSSLSSDKFELSFDETIKGEKDLSVDYTQTCSIYECKTNQVELINLSEGNIGVKPENFKNSADCQHTLNPSNAEDNVLGVHNQNDIKRSSDVDSTIAVIENKGGEKNELCITNQIEAIDDNKSFTDKSEKSFIEHKDNKDEIESSNNDVGSNKSASDTEAQVSETEESEIGYQNQTTSVHVSSISLNNTEQCLDESLLSKETLMKNDFSAQKQKSGNAEESINGISTIEEKNKENGLDDLNDSSNSNISSILSDNVEQDVNVILPIEKITKENGDLNDKSETDVSNIASVNVEQSVNEITKENELDDINDKSNTDMSSIASVNVEQSVNEITKENELDDINDKSNTDMSSIASVNVEQSVNEITKEKELDDINDKSNTDMSSIASVNVEQNVNEITKENELDDINDKSNTDMSSIASVNVEQSVNEITKENELDDINDKSNTDMSSIASVNLEQNIVEPSLPENMVEFDSRTSKVDANLESSNILEESLDGLQVPEDNIENNAALLKQTQKNITGVEETILENSEEGTAEKPEVKEAYEQEDVENQSVINDAISGKIEQSTDEVSKLKKFELNIQSHNLEDQVEPIPVTSSQAKREVKENEHNQKVFDNIKEKDPNYNSFVENCVDKITESTIEKNELDEQIPHNIDSAVIDDQEQRLNDGNNYEKNEPSYQSESNSHSEISQVENTKLEENLNSINLHNEKSLENPKSVPLNVEQIHDDGSKTLSDKNGPIEAIVNKSILSHDSESTFEYESTTEKKGEKSILKECSEDEINTSEGNNGETELHTCIVITEKKCDSKEAHLGTTSVANEDHIHPVENKNELLDNNSKSCELDSVYDSEPVPTSEDKSNVDQDKPNQISSELSGGSNPSYKIPHHGKVTQGTNKIYDNSKRNTKILKTKSEAVSKNEKNKSKAFITKNETVAKKGNSLSLTDKKRENKDSRNEIKEKNYSKIPLLEKNTKDLSILPSGNKNNIVDKKIADQKDPAISNSNQSDQGITEKQPVATLEIKVENRKAAGVLGKRPGVIVTKTQSMSKQETKKAETEVKKDSAGKLTAKHSIKESSCGDGKEKNLLGKRPNGKSDGVSTKKSKVNEGKQKLKTNHSHFKKEDESKEQNSDTYSVVDFIDIEADEVGKEESPVEESSSPVDFSSDSSVKSVSDFLDCEAKEDKKQCAINTVENLFDCTVVAACSESDEDDCDWIPPQKKINKEKMKIIQNRTVKVSSKSQENSQIRGKQNKNSLPENKILTDDAKKISTKQGIFCVSSVDVSEEGKCGENYNKSVLDTKQTIFSVTDICEATSNKTQDKTTPGFIVTEDVPAAQSFSKSVDPNPTETDETSHCCGTAVLPSRITKKEIQKAFEEVGINDIVSIEYTGDKVVLLQFSKMKSLKRALKLYGQIKYKNEPIYILAGKDCP